MMEFSIIKRNEILIHVTTWIYFENIISKICQTQKDKHCVILLI